MYVQHIFLKISDFLLTEVLVSEQAKARDFFYSVFGLRDFGTLSEDFGFNYSP